MTEKLPKIIFAFSNNAITSKVMGIFLWNKKQSKADKIVFLIKENVFPKYALILQILRKFGNFRHIWGGFLNFFCLMWLEWAPLWVFQRIRTTIYTSTYFPEKLLNLPADSKYFRNWVIFSSLFCIVFFSFAVSLTNYYTCMEYNQILPGMMA